MSKRDLVFRTPLMNAAGTLGFYPTGTRAPEARAATIAPVGGEWADFGAFVTNPLSLRPRAPTADPHMLPYSGGFLLHTGLPNPGLSATLKAYAVRWAAAKLPIIVHLMADRPEETAQMVQHLENVENVAAVELGFAPLLANDIILLAVEMSLGELPLIVSLPWEQVLTLGPRLIQTGASAISLSAPHGALPLNTDHRKPPNGDRLITGRLYGPSLFPQALALVHDAARIGLPIIGGGGVYSQENVDAMLAAGAFSVQLDGLLWRSGWQPHK